MTQSIHPVTVKQFMSALQLNRRACELVRSGCNTTDEIELKVGKEFWRRMGLPLAKQARGIKAVLCYDNAEAVGGYLLLEGELLGFHNLERGKGDWMMQHAIKDGADRLDCFEGPMAELARKYGFQTVLTEKNITPGGPDVVWMRLQ